MSAPVLEAPAEAARNPRPSLLKAEARRLVSRRFVRVLLLLGVLGYAAALVITSFNYAKPGPGVLAEAQQRADQIVAQNNQYRQHCLANPPPDAPTGLSAEEMCGPQMTVEDFGGLDNFIDKAPFPLADDALMGAQGTAFATAALVFLVGATFVGAEWTTRSLISLLFWEPRRLRVMGAKLGVLAGAAGALAVAAQAAWYGGARLLASMRGTSTIPDGWWGDLLGIAGRGTLLAVAAALLGFGIANAVRHTGAALGVGFLYFAVIESIVRMVRPAWQPWLLTDNAVAFVQAAPYKVYVYGWHTDPKTGLMVDGSREIVVTHLHAGLLWGAVALVTVGIGVLLFKRRDLN